MSGAGYCYYSLQFGRDLEKPQLNSLNNKGGSYAYLDFCIDPVPRSRRGAIRRSSAGFAAPATFGTTGKSNQRASSVGHVSGQPCIEQSLSLIHISEPTRLGMISYAVFCLKK